VVSSSRARRRDGHARSLQRLLYPLQMAEDGSFAGSDLRRLEHYANVVERQPQLPETTDHVRPPEPRRAPNLAGRNKTHFVAVAECADAQVRQLRELTDAVQRAHDRPCRASFAFVGGALKQPSMFALLAEPATGRNRLSGGASLCSY
jgi:hypothetical protein